MLAPLVWVCWSESLPAAGAKGDTDDTEVEFRLRDIGPGVRAQLQEPGAEPPVVTGP